jgi:hypothetical protein
MRLRKQNILLNLLLGRGAYLLYSMRHRLGDIEIWRPWNLFPGDRACDCSGGRDVDHIRK